MYFTVIPRNKPLTVEHLKFVFPVKLDIKSGERIVEIVNKIIPKRYPDQQTCCISWVIRDDGSARFYGWMPEVSENSGKGREWYLNGGYTERPLKKIIERTPAHQKSINTCILHDSRQINDKKFVTPKGTVMNFFEMNVDGGVDTKWLYKISCGETIFYYGKGAETVANRIRAKHKIGKYKLVKIVL